MFKNILLIITALLIDSAVSAQEISPEFSGIMILENTRTAGDSNELISYLYSTDPAIRTKALYAMANIGDSALIDKIDFLFAGPFEDYPKSEDLKAAAFMLGQIPCGKSREYLNFMLDQTAETSVNSGVISEILEATGKTGSENDLDKICSLYNPSVLSDSLLARAYAKSIGRFALRKIRNYNSVDVLKKISNGTADTQALGYCAFAFWRTGDRDLLKTAEEEIYRLAVSEDAQTRMWAYNALGKIKNELFLLYTLESFDTEKDWRVKVNMLNSIPNYNIDSVPELTLHLLTVLENGISDSNEHISMTAINVLGRVFTDINKSGNSSAKSISEHLMKEFTFALDSADRIGLSWRVKSELVNSMSLIFRDSVKEILMKEFYNTNDYEYKSGILKAVGNFNNGMVYKEVRDSVSRDVQRYRKDFIDSSAMIGSTDLSKLYTGFLEMLTGLQDKVDSENLNNIRLIYTEFMGSKDPAITGICFQALQDSVFSYSREETNLVTVFDYRELSYPDDLDVMLSFIDFMGEMKNQNAVELLENNLKSDNFETANSSATALEKITGRKYEFTAKPRTDFDTNYLNNLSQKRFITVKTTKGDIRIELLYNYAPFTVMNFLKLSEDNFYDGTVFHRVVSNFVIQGGDPSGTGYGGPGYSIRSEFSPVDFGTGIVGMASSGKDTEGSQFFITHSATPHLDGRYTVFGKVTEGMEVVNLIMIGDYITDIVTD